MRPAGPRDPPPAAGLAGADAMDRVLEGLRQR
jgi:hypothetical protein